MPNTDEKDGVTLADLERLEAPPRSIWLIGKGAKTIFVRDSGVPSRPQPETAGKGELVCSAKTAANLLHHSSTIATFTVISAWKLRANECVQIGRAFVTNASMRSADCAEHRSGGIRRLVWNNPKLLEDGR